MRQVKAIASLDGLITKDRIYTVLFEGAKGFICIADDRGENTIYSDSRFTIVLAPQVAPTFSEMQQIADSVKITGDTEHLANQLLKGADALRNCYNHAECGKSVEANHYKFCYDCWWAQDARNTVKITDLTRIQTGQVSIADLNSITDDLLVQLSARRESALEDSDANLAALLYRAIDRIKGVAR